MHFSITAAQMANPLFSLLLAVSLSFSSVNCQCPQSALSALTDIPAGLNHNVAAGTETADGENVPFTCTEANQYLEPDPESNGIFNVACAGTAFVRLLLIPSKGNQVPANVRLEPVY